MRVGAAAATRMPPLPLPHNLGQLVKALHPCLQQGKEQGGLREAR